MRSSSLLSKIASLASLASLGFLAAPARAEPRSDRVVAASGPKSSLLSKGAVTLGLSYAPALVVGATSPLPEDRYLLAPVAGPWLDLGYRDCKDCDHERLNQVLLVTDGIIQGVGAIEILCSFFFWETREYKADLKGERHQTFSLRVTPIRVSGGYGVRASGQF